MFLLDFSLLVGLPIANRRVTWLEKHSLSNAHIAKQRLGRLKRGEPFNVVLMMEGRRTLTPSSSVSAPDAIVLSLAPQNRSSLKTLMQNTIAGQMPLGFIRSRPSHSPAPGCRRPSENH